MKITSCTKEAHWTLLGFTNTKGEPVLCVTIFLLETIITKECLEFVNFSNARIALSGVKSNYGPGTVYSGPPKCTIGGKEVLVFVSSICKGSILTS